MINAKYASKKYPQLTIKREQIFDFCCDYIKEHDNFPLIKIVAYEFAISYTRAQDQIDAITDAGYFNRHGRTYKRSKLGKSVRGEL